MLRNDIASFKKSDILKIDRCLYCQTNKFSAKVAGLWRSCLIVSFIALKFE